MSLTKLKERIQRAKAFRLKNKNYVKDLILEEKNNSPSLDDQFSKNYKLNLLADKSNLKYLYPDEPKD